MNRSMRIFCLMLLVPTMLGATTQNPAAAAAAGHRACYARSVTSPCCPTPPTRSRRGSFLPRGAGRAAGHRRRRRRLDGAAGWTARSLQLG